jgi:hypothetical protein
MHSFITPTQPGHPLSLEGTAAILVLQLQQDRWIFGLNDSAHVLPIAVQHLLPQTHALVSEHQALTNGLLRADLQVESAQLVVLKLLLLLHHQAGLLHRVHPQLVTVLPRKDVPEPRRHVLQLLPHQLRHLLRREALLVEEGDVGLAAQLKLVTGSALEHSQHNLVLEGQALRSHTHWKLALVNLHEASLQRRVLFHLD